MYIYVYNANRCISYRMIILSVDKLYIGNFLFFFLKEKNVYTWFKILLITSYFKKSLKFFILLMTNDIFIKI